MYGRALAKAELSVDQFFLIRPNPEQLNLYKHCYIAPVYHVWPGGVVITGYWFGLGLLQKHFCALMLVVSGCIHD